MKASVSITDGSAQIVDVSAKGKKTLVWQGCPYGSATVVIDLDHIRSQEVGGCEYLIGVVDTAGTIEIEQR
jgi:hypothetical protein